MLVIYNMKLQNNVIKITCVKLILFYLFRQLDIRIWDTTLFSYSFKNNLQECQSSGICDLIH